MKKRDTFLPYGRQHIDDSDIQAVVDALKGDMLTTGPKVAEFEEKLRSLTGAKFAVACSNGTAALHMASIAAGLGDGGYAIVPSVTFLATANAPILAGGKVIFADVDPNDGLMKPVHLEQALNEFPNHPIKAVFPVHLNGQTADPSHIGEIAKKYGITIIEDACHAIGSAYYSSANTRYAVGGCQHSDMATFSFHPVKGFTTGEGGAVLTNDEAFFQKVSMLRSHGMCRDPDFFENENLAFDENGDPNPWYYEMHCLGFNYRITDLQCALGINQLEKFSIFKQKRRTLVDRYNQNLLAYDNWVKPITHGVNTVPAWHLYVVKVDFKKIGKSRSVVMRELMDLNIGTQVHYLPLHMQRYYKKLNPKLRLPGAEAYYESALSLPLHTSMETADVDAVCKALAYVCDHK